MEEFRDADKSPDRCGRTGAAEENAHKKAPREGGAESSGQAERSDHFAGLRNSRRIHDDSNSKSWRSDSLVLMGSADIK